MTYQNETKTCQNCKTDFIIEPDDFAFYDKMKVPSPTFCPDCRRQRRLAWFNLVNLYYRNCDLCEERFISMYPKESPHVVYCPKCWWSDKWDWRDYGTDFDFSRDFFTQFNELLHKVPLLGLSINNTTTIGSPYNNHAADLKDCYLTFNSDFNQESAYGVSLTHNRESFDSSMIMDCDTCYDCMCLYKSSKTIGTRGNNRFCIDSYFIRDCENCSDCFISANLRNKKYCIKNIQYTREAYLEKLKEYDFGSYVGYQNIKKEAESFWNTIAPRPAWDTMSVDHTGSYVFESKNCKECYDVCYAEDCKYVMMFWRKPQKSCYDVCGFGLSLEDVYDSQGIFYSASNVLFSQESGRDISNIEYSKLSLSGHYNFGCVSVRKGEYVIFNKVYSKEEYFTLREKIIKHMNEMPYVDKSKNIYKYGEFFPLELSPFPYNETFAQLFYPKTKEAIEKIGLNYLVQDKNNYTITKKSQDLPDHIKDIDESILNEVIECVDCNRGFKVIEMELNFLKKMNVPLPRQCPFCRIQEKLLLWVDNMHLKDRVCSKCNSDFKTHFGPDRAPVVICKECYKKEYF